MKRGNVLLNNPERFEKHFEISKDKLELAIKQATNKLAFKMQKYGLLYPDNDINDPSFRIYPLNKNNSWICGLHTGCYLLAYLLCGNKDFLNTASKQMADYEKRLDEKYRISDHDVGFVYTPSCMAYHKITGDENAKKVALRAAEHLYNTSYSQKGGFVLRLGTKRDDEAYCRTMMDTLLNIPLFYWAAEETGDKKFLDAANSQVDITEKYLIREDGSSFHHYQFEVGTHKPLYGLTFQGNRNESTWSRGHSWGVFGFPVAYGYTKNRSLLSLERDVVFYMLNHLPADYVPYWDYDYTEGDEPRDSSAGAIAACGLLEIAKFLPDSAPEKEIYNNAANLILNGIIDTCTGDTGEDYDGLICNVTHARRFNIGINGCNPYGDYFYLEALQRLKNPEWKHLW